MAQCAPDHACVETLVSLLYKRAQQHPAKVAYRFLSEGSGQSEALTYQALLDRATQVAGQIAAIVAPGERALLLFPSGLEFILAFFGCQLAGVIAVPAYPPRRNQNLTRMEALTLDCAPGVIMGTERTLAQSEPLLAAMPGVRAVSRLVVATSGAAVERPAGPLPQVQPDDVAFLQYTSGSTGAPKGVVLTHRIILANEQMIMEAFGTSEAEVVVSWLPLFHDMGLIGTTLQPFYVGGTTVFMAPAHFLKRPLAWLEAISEYRATVICAPNFAYELCARQLTGTQVQALQFDSVRVAVCGAEAVRASTVDLFCETFAAAGLARSAFAPTYGLAEATLLVTCASAHNRPLAVTADREQLEQGCYQPLPPAAERGQRLMSSGRPPSGCDVRIVNPKTAVPVPAGEIGEIWVAGPHVALGYWHNEGASAAIFGATLSAGNSAGSSAGNNEQSDAQAQSQKPQWLRTGDLGFIHDGELFVSGRLKDLLIIRGRNYIPTDLEHTIQLAHADLRADAGAAIGVEVDAEERLMVVQEVERSARLNLNTDAIVAAVQEALLREHELAAARIVLIRPGSILKTSSGKIQRSALRAAVAAGTLPVIADIECGRERLSVADQQWIAAQALTRTQLLTLAPAEQASRLLNWVRAELASELQQSPQSLHHDTRLLALGADSLRLMQVAQRCEATLGVHLPVADLFAATTIEALVQQILARVLEPQRSAEVPLQHRERVSAGMVSHAQERMWFLQRLHADQPAYHVPLVLQLDGVLDRESLQGALRTLLDRHEILRSTYREIEAADQNGCGLSAEVQPTPSVPLALVDCSMLNGAALLTRVEQVTAAFMMAPFDLEQGPLIRFQLLRLPATVPPTSRHRLLVCAHHIAVDGHSLRVLLKEMARAYQALLRDEDPDLTPLTFQYADYAHWHRQRIAAPGVQAQRAFWKQQLTGAAPLSLPTDFAAVAERGGMSRDVFFEVPVRLAEQVRVVSRELNCTPYVVLLAAYGLLLARYSQQNDFCIGTPVINRPHADLMDQVGLFVNTVALRFQINANPTFAELVQLTSATVVAALAHQELPFEQVVSAVTGPAREFSESPLFQTLFQYQALDISAECAMTGLDVESVPVASGGARFDVTLELSEARQRMHGHFECAADRFEQASVERLAEHYLHLLQQLVDAPDTRVRQVPLVTAAEKTWLLFDVNPPPESTAAPTRLHEFFEQTLAQHPERVAIIDGEREWRYSDLDRAARRCMERLAPQLAAVSDEDGWNPRIALCLPRRAELIAAIIAVLRSGCAYVPIEPKLPPQRIAYLINDSGAAVVMYTAETLAAEAEVIRPELTRAVAWLELEVGPDEDQANAEVSAKQVVAPTSINAGAVVSPEQLAYVIYTSGSTGLPKGVMISHRNVSSFVDWALSAYEPAHLAGVLASTSAGFDIAIIEWFVTLGAGGAIIMAEDILALPTLPARDQVTLINTVPSAIKALLDTHQIPASVRCVSLGGEALPPALVDGLYARPHIEVVRDLYGPTEDSVYSLSCIRVAGAPATIGRPIRNTRVYIVDAYDQLMPPGIPGELCLSGPGTAVGYMNRAELTAERFPPNPFHTAGAAVLEPDPWLRMYRTGDRARTLPDGTLEYLGRLDFQIKVRGRRVELGEIEAVLADHPAVRDVVVISQTDRAGQAALTAYLIAVNEPETASTLKTWLMARLPEYMVPAAILWVERWPVTANGKLDRAALPRPDLAAQLSSSESDRPLQSDTERRLASLWQGLLELPIEHSDAHFFALGGHSLLATRCVALIRQDFQCELPLRTVFDHPRLSELAAVIEATHAAAATTSATPNLNPPPLMPVSRDTTLPLSFAQMRLWFLNQLEGREGGFNVGTTYNMPAAVHLQGALDVRVLRKTFQTIVARHEILRTAFVVEDGAAVQRILAPGEWFLGVVDISALSGSAQQLELQRLAADEAGRTFDLETDHAGRARRTRLMRTRLLRLGPEEHVLLITMHHIVSDGWSVGVLMREMQVVYPALLRGERPELAELSVQYADFAVWQQQWLQGEVYACLRDYWCERLIALPTLHLPTDFPRPAQLTFNGDCITLALDSALCSDLRALARSHQTTLFTVLLSAYFLVVHRFSGQRDLCIGTPVANRARPELEALIGCFVNTLPLRVEIDPQQSVSALLKVVADIAIGAFEHEHLPFEKMVDEVVVTRETSHSPIFQVMFALQNAVDTQRLNLPGLEIEILPSAARTAKFEWTLNLEEHADTISGQLEYNTDLFERQSAHQVVQLWQQVLRQMVQSPATAIQQLQWVSDAEALRLLQHSQRGREVAGTDTLLSCWHATVASHAQRTALSMADASAQLTYAELDAQSNQLAHWLQAQGIEPGERLGLLQERTPLLLVSILSILKAGCAYVPLDPTNPIARNELIVADAQLTAVLVDKHNESLLPATDALRLVVDATRPEWEQGSGAPVVLGADQLNGASPAYIIYTSGTTGTPKGVCVSHQNVTNLLAAAASVYEFRADDRWTLFHSIAFDFSVWEVWGALTTGAELIVVPYLWSRDPIAVRELLVSRAVTVFNQTPSAFAQLIAEDGRHDAGNSASTSYALRYVIFGGEALNASTLVPWVNRYGDSSPTLINMYGITETTVHVTWQVITADSLRGGSVSIGEPLPHLRLYILDEQMRVVPSGVPGEIVVAGAGVAQGYWQRDALTLQRFVPVPFEPERVYRSGDLARYRADGSIEYLGRIDAQVKVRGYRIELEEIEAVLMRAPGIDQAVAVVRPDASGEAALFAYVVAHATTHETNDNIVTTLLAAARSALPGYMVPAQIIMLDHLPLTPNGKLNREALPAPVAQRTVTGSVAPRNETERELVAIWETVLGRQGIGVTDNFFELGGHSLLATRVISRVREQFEVDLPLSALFAEPTVESIALQLLQAELAAVDESDMADLLAAIEGLDDDTFQ